MKWEARVPLKGSIGNGHIATQNQSQLSARTLGLSSTLEILCG